MALTIGIIGIWTFCSFVVVEFIGDAKDQIKSDKGKQSRGFVL